MTDKICECGKYEDCLIDKCTCKCHEKVKTGKEIQEEIDKTEIMGKAIEVIKPSLWFSYSILDSVECASDLEIEELKRLTEKTGQLKRESWKIDNEIASILSDIDKRFVEKKHILKNADMR